MKEKDLKIGTIITHPRRPSITRIVDITDNEYIIDNRIESLYSFRYTSLKPDVIVLPKKFIRRIKPVKIFIGLFQYNERLSSSVAPGLVLTGSYVRTSISSNNTMLIVESIDDRTYVRIAKVYYSNPVAVYTEEIQYAHELQDFCEKHKLQDIACSHSYFPLCTLDTSSEPEAKKYAKDNTFNQKIAAINRLRKRHWASFPIMNYYNYEDEKE